MARNIAYFAVASAAIVALLAFLNYYFTPSLSIDTPASGVLACEPVTVTVSWGGQLRSLKATLNNSGVKDVVLMANNASKRATGLAEADAGPRVLTVSGEFKPRFLGGFYPNRTITETRSFTVKRPDLTFQPAAVAIPQPGTQQATMSRECMTIATPLTVALATNASLVAKPSQASVTLAAAQKSTMIGVTAGTRPGLAEISGSAQHHQLPFTSSDPLDATVKRATGSFARLDPAFATPTGKTNSPNGEFSVHISAAVPNPVMPPPPGQPSVWYFAQFKRGTSANSPNLAGDIQFSIDLLPGGAGFCAASTVGAVLSGFPQGHPSDYLYSLVDLRSGQPVIQEYPVWSKHANTATAAPFFYRPTLLLSPDCSLAIIAGAHPNSALEPHFLRVIDVTKRAALPGCEHAFGGLDNASDLTAKVVDKPNGKQVVEVSVAGGNLWECPIP